MINLRLSSSLSLDIFQEVVIDATFDTSWSYRIMFNWLLASAERVEAQVQLLQRRCSQFGLNLVPFPQITVSKNVYLGPFKAPAIFEIDEREKVRALDKMLFDLDYIHDGVFHTDVRAVLDCLDRAELYDFGRRYSRLPAGRQFVHRSGTLFVRVLTDVSVRSILVVHGNYLYMNRDKKLKVTARKVFEELKKRIGTLCMPPSPQLASVITNAAPTSANSTTGGKTAEQGSGNNNDDGGGEETASTKDSAGTGPSAISRKAEPVPVSEPSEGA